MYNSDAVWRCGDFGHMLHELYKYNANWAFAKRRALVLLRVTFSATENRNFARAFGSFVRVLRLMSVFLSALDSFIAHQTNPALRKRYLYCFVFPLSIEH